ncbi:hypothetical protein CHS0354_020781, partial [Potamilus streckersoni]
MVPSLLLVTLAIDFPSTESQQEDTRRRGNSGKGTRKQAATNDTKGMTEKWQCKSFLCGSVILG